MNKQKNKAQELTKKKQKTRTKKEDLNNLRI